MIMMLIYISIESIVDVYEATNLPILTKLFGFKFKLDN